MWTRISIASSRTPMPSQLCWNPLSLSSPRRFGRRVHSPQWTVNWFHLPLPKGERISCHWRSERWFVCCTEDSGSIQRYSPCSVKGVCTWCIYMRVCRTINVKRVPYWWWLRAPGRRSTLNGLSLPLLRCLWPPCDKISTTSEWFYFSAISHWVLNKL